MLASTSPTAPSSTTTILGKRKATKSSEYVLHLVSDSDPAGATDSEFEPSELEQQSTSKKQRVGLNASKPVLLNGKLVPSDIRKRYACTYEGCTKAYTKPSRLEEHERSHTGSPMHEYISPNLKNRLRAPNLTAQNDSGRNNIYELTWTGIMGRNLSFATRTVVMKPFQSIINCVHTNVMFMHPLVPSLISVLMRDVLSPLRRINIYEPILKFTMVRP
ncbi:hypothetical protein PM082_001326 [Marasmius tenuissimus]|nr:hypothetical protein PM082_001326 [Marasmius tenuissimus]